MAEHRLKLGKVKESEIEAMRDLFIWFDEEYEKHCDRDFNEYNFCNTFMEKYQKFDKTSSWQRVFLNLTTLLENCADENKDTLEFNERLTKTQDFYDGYNTHNFSEYDDTKLDEYIEQFKKNHGKILNDHPAVVELISRGKLNLLDDNTCKKCGRVLRHFNHNCNGSSNMPEIYGCPVCDDHCGFCQEEVT